MIKNFELTYDICNSNLQRNKIKDNNEKFDCVAVAQWVRAFALQAEGLVFEFQPRQSVTGPWR